MPGSRASQEQEAAKREQEEAAKQQQGGLLNEVKPRELQFGSQCGEGGFGKASADGHSVRGWQRPRVLRQFLVTSLHCTVHSSLHSQAASCMLASTAQLTVATHACARQVYVGWYRREQVAIKLLSGPPTPRVVEEFKRECDVLTGVPPHANVLALRGACTQPPHLMLVTEYCARVWALCCALLCRAVLRCAAVLSSVVQSGRAWLVFHVGIEEMQLLHISDDSTPPPHASINDSPTFPQTAFAPPPAFVHRDRCTVRTLDFLKRGRQERPRLEAGGSAFILLSPPPARNDPPPSSISPRTHNTTPSPLSQPTNRMHPTDGKACCTTPGSA